MMYNLPCMLITNILMVATDGFAYLPDFILLLCSGTPSADPVWTPERGCLVQEIANDILSEQTPKRLFAVRGKLYELLVNCIPPELILKKLMLELVRKLDDELKHKVADCAAFFEHRLQVMAAVECSVT